jgi:hypothetical protein
MAFEHPLLYVVNKYLDLSGININRNELSLQLLSHPGFPNIISISDLFHHFDLEHYALKLKSTNESLNELPEYFLAHCYQDKDPKLMLVEKKDGIIKLSWEKGDIEKITSKEFLNIWSGVVIVLDEISDENFKKVGNTANYAKLASMLFLIASMGIIASATIQIHEILILITSIIGLGVSTLVIQHELGKNLKSLNKFCKSFENTSCDQVINSEGSMLFGIFKLSDLSIIYFSAQFLFVLIAVSGSLNTKFVLTILSLLTLPMICYSVIYQGFVVKKWCPLCLALVLVLLIQVITVPDMSVLKFSANLTTEIKPALLYLILISFSALIWFFFSPLLSNENELNFLKVKHLKFKRNFNFFQKALSNSAKITKYYGLKGEIIFGNPKSDLVITMITNPTCFYCIEAHKAIEKILISYEQQLCVKIRFNLMNLNMDKTNAKVAHHFLEVFNNKGPKVCRSLMHEFYNTANKEKWMDEKEFTINQDYVQILEMHKSWCKENGINFTPSLIIDNQLFPKKYYAINDLSYFIEDLLNQKSKIIESYNV